jgi:hypothetical protein
LGNKAICGSNNRSSAAIPESRMIGMFSATGDLFEQDVHPQPYLKAGCSSDAIFLFSLENCRVTQERLPNESTAAAASAHTCCRPLFGAARVAVVAFW